MFFYGNDAALQWMRETLSTVIKEYGVAVYRQDANMRDYYLKASSDDPPDRRGMGESLHIAGLYKLLDGLLEDNPGLVMDNCAR